MLDTVINGTRTSRSILGNLSIPDDPAEAISLLKSSGWPIDLGPLNPAGLSQKGTDLNKANLLSDETAALYGLGPDAVPDDALRILGSSRVLSGSYVGTGENGSYENPVELTFGFRPSLVIIFVEGIDFFGGVYSQERVCNCYACSMYSDKETNDYREIRTFMSNFGPQYIIKMAIKFTSTGISRYLITLLVNGSYAPAIMNQANERYRYIAIG